MRRCIGLDHHPMIQIDEKRIPLFIHDVHCALMERCPSLPSFCPAGQSRKHDGQPGFLRGGDSGAAGRPGLQQHPQTQIAGV